MGAFGRTAAEYGALSRPTQRRHTPQPRMTRVLSAVPGFDEPDAAAADPTREDPRTGSPTSSALSPESQQGGQLLRPGLLAHPKEHAESVDHVGLDSRRDGAVRPAGLT